MFHLIHLITGFTPGRLDVMRVVDDGKQHYATIDNQENTVTIRVIHKLESEVPIFTSSGKISYEDGTWKYPLTLSINDGYKLEYKYDNAENFTEISESSITLDVPENVAKIYVNVVEKETDTTKKTYTFSYTKRVNTFWKRAAGSNEKKYGAIIGTALGYKIQYKKNNENWQTSTTTVTIENLNVEDKIYIKIIKPSGEQELEDTITFES